MPVVHPGALAEVDPQRGAVHVRLDVVDGQGVACEEHVHVPGRHESRERRCPTSVDDGRSADPQDAFACRLAVAHLVGDLTHLQGLRLLARDHRVHELEHRLGLRPRRRGDDDLHPEESDDDRLTLKHVRHRHRRHVTVADDQAAVHLGILYLNPLPGDPDEGLEVRARVESFGEHAVHGCRDHLGIAGLNRVHTVVLKAYQQVVQRGVVLMGDEDAGP